MPYFSNADAVQRLRALHDHLPAGVVVHAADGRIVFANRMAQELLGRTEEQLLSMAVDSADWVLVREDGSPLPLADVPVNVVLRSRRHISGMVIGIEVGGAIRWLLCNAYPEFNGGATLQQAVVCFTDCTGLKNTQRSLEESEERLRLVLKGSTDAPWDWDLVSGKVFYSARWWSMLGYRGDEGYDTYDGWLRLMHRDDDAMVAAYVADLLPSPRESFGVEFRLRHRDGHYVPVLARGYVSRDASGTALRISGVNTDLTERKQTEQRIYRLAYCDQLTGLRNRSFLIEELEHVLARAHRSDNYGALLYLDLDNFKLLNDTMGHDFGDMLLRQVADRLRHRDGHYLPILTRGYVTRDARGRALRVSGTNTDLTERKQAEQRIY